MKVITTAATIAVTWAVFMNPSEARLGDVDSLGNQWFGGGRFARQHNSQEGYTPRDTDNGLLGDWTGIAHHPRHGRGGDVDDNLLGDLTGIAHYPRHGRGGDVDDDLLGDRLPFRHGHARSTVN